MNSIFGVKCMEDYIRMCGDGVVKDGMREMVEISHIE